jgi:hypothetical protein
VAAPEPIHDLTSEYGKELKQEFEWAQHRVSLVRYIDRAITADPPALIDSLAVHTKRTSPAATLPLVALQQP